VRLEAKPLPLSPARLPHSIQDDRTIAGHALGFSLQGSGQNGSEFCRLFPADIPRRDPEIRVTRRVGAINPWPPLDHVQVQLENATFSEDQFGDRHQREFRSFAQNRAAGPEKQILHELLRERGSTANAIAFDVFFRGDLDLVPIEPVMLVKACILGGDDGVLQVGRDLAERNEFVTLLVGDIVEPGLYSPLHVDSGRGRVDPAEPDQQQRKERPQQERAEENPPDD